MLTKDLVRFRAYKGVVKPQFIKPDRSDLLHFAEQLLSLYCPESGITRGELQENAAPLINSFKDLKLTRGLNKLVLDRCEFSHVSDIDYPRIRDEIFTQSAELLKEQSFEKYSDFRNEVLNNCESEKKCVENGIYADLPENEKLIKIRKIFPLELLHRYNVALVQALLLYTDKINIELTEPEPAKLRNLFKYLKFFRLLAKVTRMKPGPEKNFPAALHIQIDGPASIFENTQKYGLQLASFFPAICSLKKWKIHSRIKFREKDLTLLLDQSAKLVSHYRNFSDYIPEEIRLFKDLFNKKNKEWQIIENADFIDAGNNELIFPDFVLQNHSDSFHLELFHRWHSFQLLDRLKFAEKNPQINLIIGVDRFLANKPEIKELLDNSAWFQNNGFLFRDFPGVDIVTRVLKKIITENKPTDDDKSDQQELEL